VGEGDDQRRPGRQAARLEDKMPLARIDLVRGKSADYRRTIGDVVYDAIVDILKAPVNDRFQVITEHLPEDHIADDSFLGITRTQDCVFIQVTLNSGRTLEQKKGFYKAVADGLHQRLGIRREDVLINLVEVAKENWSFGNGVAQYAT
jgi:4-oxalocrotonate tautomerase